VKIIVGLGNPGMTYHRTRHNVGFMVIDRLSRRHGVSISERTLSQRDSRPASVYGEYPLGEEVIRIVMPLTMMNESGEALRDLPVDRQNLLVICDDVNLPVGSLRLRPQGGAGGHHGLESCLEALGTEDFARLRVGVGGANMPADLRAFVLSPFSDAERPIFEQTLEQAAEACEVWAVNGIEEVMNRYNRVHEA